MYISTMRLKTENLKAQIHKTHILPKVGNMTLLPNPGKPGFYGVGLPGLVISCQPCRPVPADKMQLFILHVTYTRGLILEFGRDFLIVWGVVEISLMISPQNFH